MEDPESEAFFVQFIRALNRCEPDIRQQSNADFAEKHIFPQKGQAQTIR